MPLKGFLSMGRAKEGHSSSGPEPSHAAGVSPSGVLSDGEKLSMLNELEKSGLGWFWASDASGNLTYISPAIADRLNVDLDALLGQSLITLFENADREGRSKTLSFVLSAHRPFSGLNVQPTSKSQNAVLRLSGKPVFDGDTFTGYRGTGADITEEYYREAETARLAKYDSLTGLSNRHRMAQKIDATITAFKAAKRNCAVMMLDLDKFKHVNDTLGHAAGDELLKQVADRLQRAIEVECEIGRLGGDEFQIMIPDKDDRGELGEIAMKIITMLSQPYSLEEGRSVIGCSIGIAIAPHDGVTAEDVVRSADLALYSAKNGGRGRFRFFSGELENESLFRRRLEQDLGLAVRENQLFLRYEPIVCATTENVCALETHICWEHEQRGEIDEIEFAKILEGSSRITEVGTWAIREACQHAAQWPDSVRVAVNIPVQLFTSEGFVEAVSDALNDAGLSSHRLELEISEAVFFGETNVIDRTLDQLFKMGVRMTLDEFGSGYSSLAYLRRAPFDAIKIDEALVAEAEENDSDDLGLITAIVALAGALEMDTIANGIQTTTLFAQLKDCGVKYMEGPIYSDPVGKEIVEAKLTGDNWKIAPSHDRVRRSKRRTVFRKIHIIHDDYSYEVTLRNLSRSGALIQGLADVPKGTQFVLDLGGGQLAVATVIRTNGDTQGVEFEEPLVDDGAGGLFTRNRVSPYALASAGAPLSALSPGAYEGMRGGDLGNGGTVPQFSYAGSVRSDAA